MDAIPPAELEVLKLLWAHGPCTARKLHTSRTSTKKWARTTVLTLLKRLENRGLISVDRSEWSHQFVAAVSRDDVLCRAFNGLADEYTDGSSLPLVQALVRGASLSKRDIAELKDMVKKLDKGKKK